MRLCFVLGAATCLASLLLLLRGARQAAAFVPAGARASSASRNTRRSSSTTGTARARDHNANPAACRLSLLQRRLAAVMDETEIAVENSTVPRNMPSDKGIDYIPLANMLMTADFKAADQFTRDVLIQLAGEGAKQRNFVYWTEVSQIPATDMATIEKLWLKYSNGKFGYSVQRKIWYKQNGDFENFCRKISWTIEDNNVERKRRWFGESEFIYDVDSAPVGHLPLTSALRSTQLLQRLLHHPVWEMYDWETWKDMEF